MHEHNRQKYGGKEHYSIPRLEKPLVHPAVYRTDITLVCLHERRPKPRSPSLLTIFIDVSIFEVHCFLSLGVFLALRNKSIECTRKIATICLHLFEITALDDVAVDHEIDIIDFR